MSKPPEEVASQMKEEYWVAVAEMMYCAETQLCNTLEKAKDTRQFLEILKALHKDQVYVVGKIKEAGEILAKKLKEYEAKFTEANIDDL